MKITTVKALQDYRKQHDTLMEYAAVAHMPIRYGTFKAYGYRNLLSREHHVALVKRGIGDGHDLLCRVYSGCLAGDAFGSLRYDCRQQLTTAMARTEQEGRGILLYTYQEGRGIGLLNKLRAYELQGQDMDTLEANLALGFPGDLGEYFIGAQVLGDLNARTPRLPTNNSDKVYQLSGFSLDIKERVPIQITPTDHNSLYLRVKEQRVGHLTHY